jgi:hypothetical protein
MGYEPENASKWRLRAQMLRSRAQETKDEAARAGYLALADEWDAKANAAETAPFKTDGRSR